MARGKAWLVCAAICLVGSAASAESPREKWQRSADLCDQGKWAEAKSVSEEVTREHPEHAFGWMCLGWARLHTGQPREAIPALLKALELGAMSPYRIHLVLAHAHMALGDKDAALAWLEKGVAARAPSRQRLLRDGRLAALKDEVRFKSIALDIDVTGMNREQGWRADIDLLSAEIKRLHYQPFRNQSEAQFDRAMASLKADIANLDDDTLVMKLMQILRPVADGHTQLLPSWRAGAGAMLLPLRMEWFDEGLYVTEVPEGRETLLWAKVEKFDDTAVEMALERIATVIPRDNDMWVKSRAPFFLRFPQLLKPLGIAKLRDRVTLTITTHAGKQETALLEAGKPPTKWIKQPPEHAGRLPRYRQKLNDNYWFEALPGGVVYFQFNAVQDKPGDGESLNTFADRLSDFISREKSRALVIDLRWNGGGNLNLHGPLIKRILATPSVNRRGGLYLIVGRNTFSAAQVFAGYLEHFGYPVFAGEPTGSSPNFIGENSELTLPYTKIRASISNLYWQTSYAQDGRTWIAPELPVPFVFADWSAGRDAALERVLKAIE